MNPEFWKWSKDERYAAGYEQGYKDGETKRLINNTNRTVASVLLERWAKDTREMAKRTIETKDGGLTFMYHMAGRVAMGETEDYEKAIQREIAYLNSAAEVGK